MAYACIKRGSSGDGFYAVSQENPPFFIPIRLLEAWHLQEGMELGKEQYLALKALYDGAACREKALKYLAVREHTLGELRQKLTLKQFSPQTIEQVLSSLKEEGLQSDKRYAEVFVRSRQRRNPEGKSMLVCRLRAKGVSSEIAKSAVEEAFSCHGEEYVRAAWESVWPRSRNKEACMRKVQAKGFSYGEIKRMLENL